LFNWLKPEAENSHKISYFKLNCNTKMCFYKSLFFSADICTLPPIHPHLISCLTFSEKWTYDARQAACVEFLFGGCFGTRNLFDSAEACQAKCATRSQLGRTVDVCGLTIEKGPCRTYEPSFGFNRETNRCEKFIYGGEHEEIRSAV
jgi:hypothetical protein